MLQAFGCAHSMGYSQAHSPCLQHRHQLVGGIAPKPPFFQLNYLSIIVFTFVIAAIQPDYCLLQSLIYLFFYLRSVLYASTALAILKNMY